MPLILDKKYTVWTLTVQHRFSNELMGLENNPLSKGILILLSFAYAPVVPNLYDKMRRFEECLRCSCPYNENGWRIEAVKLQKAP